jgi:hypothetical protein
MYFGMKDGNIVFVNLEKAYNQIPFKKVESIDGLPILGISVADKGYGKFIYTISEDSSVKLFCPVEEEFKLKKN